VDLQDRGFHAFRKVKLDQQTTAVKGSFDLDVKKSLQLCRTGGSTTSMYKRLSIMPVSYPPAQLMCHRTHTLSRDMDAKVLVTRDKRWQHQAVQAVSLVDRTV